MARNTGEHLHFVYTILGGEENYENALINEGYKKGYDDGFIEGILKTAMATITIFVIVVIAKITGIPFFKRKYQELIEKRKKKKLKQKNTETEDKDANTMPGMRITGKH